MTVLCVLLVVLPLVYAAWQFYLVWCALNPRHVQLKKDLVQRSESYSFNRSDMTRFAQRLRDAGYHVDLREGGGVILASRPVSQGDRDNTRTALSS